MKKYLKYFLLVVLVIPMVCFFSACDYNTSSSEVVSIEKTSSVGYEDTYTITYGNGKTYCFTVTNGSNGSDGKDGQDYDITTIYEEAQKAGFDGSFLDFIELYLDYDEDLLSININKSLLSIVSVYSKFTKMQAYIQMGRIYSQEVSYSSAGSGVIYFLDKENGNAYIITNYHVVYDVDSLQTDGISDEICIYLYGYEDEDYAISASFYGGSMDYDIAVLEIENSDLLKNSDAREVEVADSNDINVGDKAIAIGNPEALGISATSGIVSVDSEYITMTSLDEKSYIKHRVIRVDTAVNGGNSGGGLFNSNGKLIGIVNAKITDESIENIAFAIPSNIATGIAQNIINNNGNFMRLVMGASLDTQNTKSVYNTTTQMVDIVEDVTIETIDENSLASTLGFNVGDKIVSVSINDNLVTVDRMFKAIDCLYKAKKDDSITFVVERDNSNIEFSFIVKEENLVNSK